MTKTTERHQALLHMLNARGYATIDELTKCFSVTPQTIRKDINTLAGQGKVQRFHGGVGMPLSTENILYEQRKKLFLPEKKAIAQMLAKHIPDGASICINLGTTTEEVAYALLGHNNLRVLTNNLNVAAIMARNPNFDVVVAGGTVRHHDHGIIGPSAENFIREFRVDYGIIGISGIDQEGNMLDFDYREVSVARTIIECSRRVFLATDNSKFGRSAMVRVANVCDIEAVFSTAPLEEHWQHMLQEAGTELYLV